jgi:hypothetical protein
MKTATRLLVISLFLIWFWPTILVHLGWAPTDAGNASPLEVARSVGLGMVELATGMGNAGPAVGAQGSGGADGSTLSSETRRNTCAAIRICGNGFVDIGEECDGADLSGQSCSTLGYAGNCKGNLCLVNELACSASCQFDTRGCTALSSGQPPRFVDNGDGTITDRSLRVMWEKKCTGSACPKNRQLDTRFDWLHAASTWLMDLNRAGEHGFAGYDDWRLPTVLELSSLPKRSRSCASGCIDPVFGAHLTADWPYWSSSTSHVDPARAWQVSFREAQVMAGDKSDLAHVRAVRKLSTGSAVANNATLPLACRTLRLCGNGVVDANEACDGLDLAGQTCRSLGFDGDCRAKSSSGACVASGLSCDRNCSFDPSGCTSSGRSTARFVTHWDGTVIDRLTGLQWQRNCSGSECAGSRSAGEVLDWQTAMTKWVDELNQPEEELSGVINRWRLPNLAEVRSVLQETPQCNDGDCSVPKILGFDGREEVFLWTSTTSAKDTAHAWRAALSERTLDTAKKTAQLHVLAVRRHSPRSDSELAIRR